MRLQFATLSYGQTRCPVKPTETVPLPGEFDFENPEDCARKIAAIMSNASGGHVLRRVRLAIYRERGIANITAEGAHVFFAPDDRAPLSAEQVAQLATEQVVTYLGDVETDQYGDGWQRARWTQTKERFSLYKGETGLWIVQDGSTDPCEDATLYTFPTRKKATVFRDMMITEHGRF